MYVIVITLVKSRNICDGIVTIKVVTQCKKHLWSGRVESGCGELNILTIGMPCQPTYSVQFRSAVMSLQTIIFFFFFFFIFCISFNFFIHTFCQTVQSHFIHFLITNFISATPSQHLIYKNHLPPPPPFKV